METGLPSFGHGSPFILTKIGGEMHPLKLDFEAFVSVIILDRNSQICFHKAILTKAKGKTIVHGVMQSR
jgi:hypothetical protein